MKDTFEKISGSIFQADRFTITKDILRTDGKEFSYSYVNIRPGICAIVETDKGYIVQKEYRYPIKQWSYEFTAGVIDDGEAPEEAAIREIKEETGYKVSDIVWLGKFYPSFGATDEVIYLFYAKCSEYEQANREFSELITDEYMSKDEVEQLITSGEFKHGAGLAAWLRYKLWSQNI